MGWKPSQVGVYDEHKDLSRKRRWYGINGIAAALAGLWLAGSLGVVGRGEKTVGWIGKEFDDLYRYIPFMHSS
jgi:hypothetical protein